MKCIALEVHASSPILLEADIVEDGAGVGKSSKCLDPKYFQQTEEKIYSMDTRKQLRFPDRSPPSKTIAINTPDTTQKPKGKGNPGSQSVPPAKAGQQQKGSPQKKEEKGAGKSSEGKSQPKSTAPPKPCPPSAANPPPPKPGGGNTPNKTEKRLPGTVKKQCVPYTLADGCVNGNNCPFQHANDPVTKKPLHRHQRMSRGIRLP